MNKSILMQCIYFTTVLNKDYNKDQWTVVQYEECMSLIKIYQNNAVDKNDVEQFKKLCEYIVQLRGENNV